MSKHRLMTDFANRPEVRYLTQLGSLWRVSGDSPVATTDRILAVGDTFEVSE